MKKIAVILLFCFFSINCFAALESTSSVTIRIENKTLHTLSFTGVSGFNPTNVISVNRNTLRPGEYIEMTGTTSTSDDLVGNVHFEDEKGLDNIFVVKDYRQFHVGQAYFGITNEWFVTQLLSETLNPDRNPRSLGISHVTIALAYRD